MPAIRRSINLALQEDIERLQQLTGVDVSHWLADSHLDPQG